MPFGQTVIEDFLRTSVVFTAGYDDIVQILKSKSRPQEENGGEDILATSAACKSA